MILKFQLHLKLEISAVKICDCLLKAFHFISFSLVHQRYHFQDDKVNNSLCLSSEVFISLYVTVRDVGCFNIAHKGFPFGRMMWVTAVFFLAWKHIHSAHTCIHKYSAQTHRHT